MKNIIGILLLLTITQFTMAQDSKILLKTDFEGVVSEGSIEALIEAIQNGESIRVGWQLDFNGDQKADLEHWIDANFISILNGHVFNQIEPIYRQIPKAEIPQIEIQDSKTQWTGIIGTNGKLVSRYLMPDLEKVEDEKMRKVLELRAQIRERTVATIWAKD